MGAIFISYRREDTEGQAGRLFDDLVMQFGDSSVFMDVAGIEPGRDFRRAIDEQVASCGVLLAVIGKDWVEAKDGSGRRRLDDPLDFVRLETASALKRDIPVIPVLVRGANMPRVEQLPPDLADLAYRNAVELTHTRWDSDVQVLIKALRPYVKPSQTDGRTAKPNAASGPVSAHASSEAGLRDSARVTAGPRAKGSRGLIIAIALAAIAVAIGGYITYDKVSRKPTENNSSVEAEKTSGGLAKKTDPGEAKSVADNRNSKPTPEPIEAPGPSYSLNGKWEENTGQVFAIVADPKQKGLFEMDIIDPPSSHTTLWKATLKGRDVEIDVFELPSRRLSVHMKLELSLDGNEMKGFSNNAGETSRDDAWSVSYRRIK